MRKLATTLLLFIAVTAQAQWTAQQAPLPSTLMFVDALAPNDVFIAGGGKKVFHRAAMGSPWVQQPIVTTLDPIFNGDLIGGACRINDSVLVVVLESIFELQEFALRSSDNGVTWDVVHIGPDYTGFLDMVYLPGDQCVAVGKGGRIVVGLNEGMNWVVNPSFTQADFWDIEMWNASTGYIVGDGIVMRTDDGALSWQTVYEGPEYFKRVSVWGGTTLYATAYDGPDVQSAEALFMRSTDGGQTWERLSLPFTNYFGVQATAANTVYVAGILGLYRTTTGGDDWYTFPEVATEQLITTIDFSDPQNGVGVGLNGAILETNNGGGTGAPVAFFSVDSLHICVGTELTFSNHSPTGLSYQWSLEGDPIASSYDATILFNQPGGNTVTLTVSDGTSETSWSVVVDVDAPPVIPPFTIDLNGGAVCQGADRYINVDPLSGVQFRFRVNGVWVTTWDGSVPIGYTVTDVQQDVLIEVEAMKLGSCGPTYVSVFDTLHMVPDALPVLLTAVSDSVCLGAMATVTLDQLQTDYLYHLDWSRPSGTVVLALDHPGADGPTTSQFLFEFENVTPLTVSVIAIQQACTTTVAVPLTITLDPISAEFEAMPPQAMVGVPITMVNTSIGTQFQWTTGANTTVSDPTTAGPDVTFLESGNDQLVTLLVTNHTGCTAAATLEVDAMLQAPGITTTECMAQQLGIPATYINYGTGLSYYFSPLDMATDAQGNMVVTGCYRDIIGNFYGDALFISKYARDGTLIWDKRTDMLSYERTSMGVAVDIDANGNIVVAGLLGAIDYVGGGDMNLMFYGMNLGQFFRSAGFVLKLDPDGNPLWSIHTTVGSFSDQYPDGISDVMFLPDGGAVFAMNASPDNRTITFADNQTVSMEDVAPPYGLRNSFLVKVDQNGELVSILPGSFAAGTGSTNYNGPFYCPEAMVTSGASNTPLTPKLLLSCDGDVQAWSVQDGRHNLGGTLYGQPNEYYYALSTTDQDLSTWGSHHLFATMPCGQGHNILRRPLMAAGANVNTSVLAITTYPSYGSECDTVYVLSDGTAIHLPSESAVFLINDLTGQIQWTRELRGIEIKELVRVGTNELVVFGQAFEYASVSVDGTIVGQNGFQQRDLVWMRFDLDGNFIGLNSLGSPIQDMAFEAVGNGCGEITVLAAMEGEAYLGRYSLDGTCNTNICTGLQFTECGNELNLCYAEPLVLDWNVSGAIFGLVTLFEYTPGGDTTVLQTGIDASLGQAVWTPDTASYNGGSVVVGVADQLGNVLDMLEVQLMPAISVGLTADTTVVCAGDSIALGTTTPFVLYNWSIGSSEPGIHVQATGTYSVTVTDDYGCYATDSIAVIVLTDELFATDSTAVCGVTETQVLATPGFDEYIWSTGYTGPLASQPTNTSGLITVQATSALGCGTIDSIYVDLIPPLAVSLTEMPVYCIGGALSVTIVPPVPVSYVWMSSGTTPTQPIFGFPTTYSVTVTDAGGCQYTASQFISPVLCVGVEEYSDALELHAQPNPVINSLTVTHPITVQSISVLDALGALAVARSVRSGSRSTDLDVSMLRSGAYVIEARFVDGTARRIVFVKQ